IAKTATREAIPIEIPSTERAARSLRVRKPTVASRSRSRGSRRLLIGALKPTVADGDSPRQRARDLLVVGDDHQRRASRVQLPQQLHQLAAGAAVEVARRL